MSIKEHDIWEALKVQFKEIHGTSSDANGVPDMIEDLQQSIEDVEVKFESFRGAFRATVIGSLNTLVALLDNVRREQVDGKWQSLESTHARS